jgi:hypothetical protein
MKKALIIVATLLLFGCATPFAQFYYDQTGGIDITKISTVIISTDNPKLFRGNDPDKDSQQMLEDGYTLLGYSSFNAGNVNEDGAINQAKDIHASVVVLYSKYTNTLSGSMPLTLPDNKTSTTYGSGNVYSSGNVYGYGGSAYYSGSSNYSGSSTTTTYGSKTTYIPYNVNRYDYLATYWIKIKSPIFGVHTEDLSTELRQKIGSNKGVIVNAVIKNSPAFQADILKGDILKRIEDVEIYDVKSFHDATDKYAGKKVHVIFFRDGNEINKEIELNNRQSPSSSNTTSDIKKPVASLTLDKKTAPFALMTDQENIRKEKIELSEQWEKAGTTLNGLQLFIDNNTKSNQSEDIVRVWVKTIANTDNCTDLLEIDCEQRKIKKIDIAKESLAFPEQTDEWKFIVPETASGLIFNSVCLKK